MVSGTKKHKKSKSKISFDEEVVNKDDAKILVSNSFEAKPNKPEEDPTEQPEKKVKRKRPKTNEDTPAAPILKKTKNTPDDQPQTDPPAEENTAEEAPKQPAKESIRSRKKKKHMAQIEQKKLKIELEMQQKSLNYLSKWKHSRSEWKFEKLRQVWLQQNLFDSSKIPEEFWETAVEYFSGAKGNSKQAVLDKAIEIIEQDKSDKGEEASEEKQEEEVGDDGYRLKMQRARDVVQNLE